MSDEQTPPLTGDVQDGPAPLVPQQHGGALHSGRVPKPKDPTPADLAADMRKRVLRAIPGIDRIAQNKPDRRKRKEDGPHKVAEQLRAFEVLLRGAMDEKKVSYSDLHRVLQQMGRIIREYFGPARQDDADRLISAIAPLFMEL